jgi:hypothetical protein
MREKGQICWLSVFFPFLPSGKAFIPIHHPSGALLQAGVCVSAWIPEKEYCLLLLMIMERQIEKDNKNVTGNCSVKNIARVNEVREEDEEKSHSQYGANRFEGPEVRWEMD